MDSRLSRRYQQGLYAAVGGLAPFCFSFQWGQSSFPAGLLFPSHIPREGQHLNPSELGSDTCFRSPAA